MPKMIPSDTTRRNFLAGLAAAAPVAAFASMPAPAAASLAVLASSDVDDPIFALIARHRAEEEAYAAEIEVLDKLCEIIPAKRIGRVQFGMVEPGRPNYLYSHKAIDDCLVAGSRHSPKIKAQLHAELDRDRVELAAKREEIGVTAAEHRVEQLCESCHELEWALASTMPTSIAGVVAVLRYANEVEDHGEEWPNTDEIGAHGWHYQMRQTAAKALETLLNSGRA